MPQESSDAAAETVPATRNDAVASTAATDQRYALLERRGEGAMGVVWEAHDRVLDRRVALKVLHDQFLGAGDQERLAQEARAMAKLSHPNVVAVYDVGERDGRTFLTMELVRGEPVSRWLEAPRGWREVLDVFRAAGEGLAAAHEAGIVHRDVKPSNILLGEDGRVRVADFGVAHASSSLEPSDVPTASSVTAGFIGSPVYMSPERLAGRAADSLGDQFAYCVALFEALHGRRPFAGDTIEALRAAIEAGPPPPVKSVPRWLVDVVARGLSADPKARFATMRDLLAALRGPRRRWWWAAGLGGGALAAAFATLLLAGGDGPSCAAGAEQLAGVWDREVAARLVATLEAQDFDFAATTARETVRVLDAYAAEWVAMYDAACRATHVDHAQSAATLESRRLCLDARRHSLQRIVGILGRDSTLVEKAPMIARGLERIADCADPGYLAGMGRTSSSAADDLALARVHLLSARYDAGRPVAERVVEAAKTRGDRGLEIEALIVRGRLESFTKERARGIDSLRAAAELAEVAGLPRARAEALIHLSATLQMMGRLDVAGEVLDTADGLLANVSDPLLSAHAASVRGTLLGRRTRYAEAVPHLERAIDGFASVYGTDSEALVPVLSNLALAQRRSGRPEAALANLRRARELTAALGESHPVAIKARRDHAIAVADSGGLIEAEQELRAVLALQQRLHPEPHIDLAGALGDLGILYSQLGRHEESLEVTERAAAIRVQLAPDARQTLTERANLADTLTQLGRAREAEPIIRDVLAARKRTLGAVHGDVALGHRQLGSALYQLGRGDEAAREYAAARAVYSELHGAEHPAIATVMHDQATGERGRRRFATALELDRKALAIRERALPSGHPARIESLGAVAANLADLRRTAQALKYAERAVAESSGVDYDAANVRWLLAQLLDAQGDDATRATELASEARTRFATMSGPAAKRALAEIDAWLARRDGSAAAAR